MRKFRTCLQSLLFFCIFAGQSLPSAKADQPAELFSRTYEEARHKFLSAAQRSGGEIEHYRHPQSDASGAPLFTDVAMFNMDKAEKVLVLGSGTHGVEGFAGSAIQLGLLREGIATRLEPGVGLLIYHALNPYGFSYLRRFNEDNIDLNRNFVEHSDPYPVNEGYEALARLMEPESLSFWSTVRAQLAFAWYRISRGQDWFQKAISQGQYTHPGGLFYGGNSVAWSNKLLREIADKYLSRSSEIILIDFHTGLGEYAAAEVIVGEAADSPVQDKTREIWGGLVKGTELGDSVSPPIEGALKFAFPRMLPESDVVAVSLEFGTYPPTKIFWVLWRENYVFHNPADAQIDASGIRAGLKDAFYPNDSDWKETVWKHGKMVVDKALEKLKEEG